MARKTIEYVVNDAGRDYNKMFLLTEMSAYQAESWATRVLGAGAVMKCIGINYDADITDLGLGAVAELGFNALDRLPWEVAEPLHQELMDCIRFVPNQQPQMKHSTIPLMSDGVNDTIEEVSTRTKLKAEVWKLNMGFFVPAFQFFLDGGAEALRKKNTPDTPI